MRYETTARDFFYETSVTALTYYITFNGSTIFNGRAVKSPNEPNLRINIGRRVSDYLRTSMPDFREFDGVVVPHTTSMGWFNLYADDGTLLEEFCVVYEFSGDFRWENCSINEPIDGKADMRQKLLISRESVSADTFVINDGEFEIYSSSGFEYAYQSGSKSVSVTATTYFSVESRSDWITNVNVTLNGVGGAITGTITFNISENEGSVDRVGEIVLSRNEISGGECNYPGTEISIAVVQGWNYLGGGDLDFVEDRFSGEVLSHTVCMHAGIPYQDRSYAFVAVPTTGNSTSVKYFTNVPILIATIEKNGNVIGTQTIYPDTSKYHQWPREEIHFTGACDVFEYVIGANTGDTADEYTVTFEDADGNFKGAIYYVQPPELPSEYEAANLLSGTGYFEYYITKGRVKNTASNNTRNGVYFEQNSQAQAAGYPRAGGYPAGPVTMLRNAPAVINSAAGAQGTITYVQSTAKSFDFEKGAAYSGLSAPNVWWLYASQYDIVGTNFRYLNYTKHFDFIDIPRCLQIEQDSVIYPVLSQEILKMNVWSLTYIGIMSMYNTSGLTTLSLPNIGCIEYNNFYDAKQLTRVMLGTTLRFFGRKDVHTGAGGRSDFLPSNIRFEYLGTKAMFQEKVLWCPKGTYYCTDGSLYIS